MWIDDYIGTGFEALKNADPTYPCKMCTKQKQCPPTCIEYRRWYADKGNKFWDILERRLEEKK